MFSANVRYSESERRAEDKDMITVRSESKLDNTGIWKYCQTYIAYAPGYCALLAGGRRLIRLAFDTEIHDVITTNSAIIHNNI